LISKDILEDLLLGDTFFPFGEIIIDFLGDFLGEEFDDLELSEENMSLLGDECLALFGDECLALFGDEDLVLLGEELQDLDELLNLSLLFFKNLSLIDSNSLLSNDSDLFRLYFFSLYTSILLLYIIYLIIYYQ
jgi:hypothetical protein